MNAIEIQPFAPSPRFTPREIIRLTQSQHGIDLCFGQLRDVAYGQIELIAVFRSGRPQPVPRLMLCITGQERPFLVPADGISYTAFGLPASLGEEEALRRFLGLIGERHPELKITASSERFLAGQPLEEVHPSEIPSRGTSMRVALDASLAAGLKPLAVREPSAEPDSAPTERAQGAARRPSTSATGEPATTTTTSPAAVESMASRYRQIRARLGIASPEPPPPVLPPFGPELRYGPHRRGELAKAFEGSPAPVRMHFRERLVGFGVALAVSLVPLLYLGCLVGLSYAIFHLAGTRGRDLAVSLVDGRWNAGGFSFLLTILVCIYLLFVLLSLLFPGRTVPRYSLFLKRNQELVLFGFVEQLSKILKAPVPERIEVAIEADVAIALRPKEQGQALTLTLGLPMVAGAKLSQLTGLIGREMAMLTERSDSWLIAYTEGLRTSLERMLADCLERQERTVRGLESRAEEGKSGLGSIVRGLGSFVFFSLARILATIFATLGDWTAGWSRRWLGRAARQVEQRLVGPRTTLSVEALARDLRSAHREVIGGVASASSGFPRLDHLPAQVVFESLVEEPSRHRPPSSEEPRPVFQSSLPATVLFRDFAELSRRATVEYYRSQGIRKPDLEPIERFLDRQWDDAELEASLRRFFGGTVTSRRPVPVAPRLEASDRPNEALLPAVLGLRGEFEATLATYRADLEDHDVATDCRLGAREAYKLVEADLEHQGIPVSEWKVLEEDALRRLQELGPVIQQHEKRSGQRLMSTLQLLSDADLRSQIPGCEGWQGEVPQLLSTVVTINRSFQAVLELRDRYNVLETLHDVGDQSEEGRRLALEIFEREIETLYSPVSKLYRGLGSLANVFHYGGLDLGLAIRGIPQDYFALSRELLGRIYEVYFRALGRLAYIAERLELASGLAPFPDQGAFPESRPWRG